MQTYCILDHHSLPCCIVHHTVKVGHIPQAVAAKLEAVGGKTEAVVTSVKRALAVVGRPVIWCDVCVFV